MERYTGTGIPLLCLKIILNFLTSCVKRVIEGFKKMFREERAGHYKLLWHPNSLVFVNVKNFIDVLWSQNEKRVCWHVWEVGGTLAAAASHCSACRQKRVQWQCSRPANHKGNPLSNVRSFDRKLSNSLSNLSETLREYNSWFINKRVTILKSLILREQLNVLLNYFK